jgi:hypothetical protein
MAVPFYIPEEDESNVPQAGEASAASSSNNTPAASPSRPIPIPLRSNPQSPQSSPIDNEVLVQAFYEALCRCSQGLYARQKKLFRDQMLRNVYTNLTHMTRSHKLMVKSFSGEKKPTNNFSSK